MNKTPSALRPLASLLLAGLLAPTVMAGDLPPASTAQEPLQGLHAELVRRVNAHEPVAGLFVGPAAASAADGWRQLQLQGVAEVIREGEGLRTRQAARLRTETPLSADCPVVETVLQPEDRVLVWQAHGVIDATWTRTPDGWRIASLKFVQP